MEMESSIPSSIDSYLGDNTQDHISFANSLINSFEDFDNYPYSYQTTPTPTTTIKTEITNTTKIKQKLKSISDGELFSIFTENVLEMEPDEFKKFKKQFKESYELSKSQVKHLQILRKKVRGCLFARKSRENRISKFKFIEEENNFFREENTKLQGKLSKIMKITNTKHKISKSMLLSYIQKIINDD